MGIEIGILGILIGSFLNVCIYRIPLGKSISFPPSHCPICKKNLKWYDNIPLISYIFILRGRCSKCKCKISIQYPLVELLCGILFYICGQKYSFSLEGIIGLIFIVLAIVGSGIDIKEKFIPDRINLLLLVLGIVFNTLIGNLENSILGIGAFSLLFIILYGYGETIFKKDVMGFGDVKLAMGIGAILGYSSFQEVLYFINIAFISGAIISIFLILTKLKSRDEEIAFGPYILIAGLVLYYLKF